VNARHRPGLGPPAIDVAALLRSAREPRVATITTYLVAITAAELFTAFVNAQAGVVLHALILFALLNHSMLLGPLAVPRSGALSDDPARVLVALLSLLPLLRVFSLTMPTRQVSPYFWYLLIGAPLLTAIVLVARYIHFSPVDAGIWRWSQQQGVLAAAGIPLGVIAYVSFHRIPVVESHEVPYLIIGTAILVVFLGLVEELIFRALLQPHLCALYGGTRGVVMTAALSAVFSSGSRSPVTILFTFAVALGFGWVVYSERSIMGVAIAHGLIGIMTVLVLPNL
jgi:membrane protease YdiL (CAAX protease family)